MIRDKNKKACTPEERALEIWESEIDDDLDFVTATVTTYCPKGTKEEKAKKSHTNVTVED